MNRREFLLAAGAATLAGAAPPRRGFKTAVKLRMIRTKGSMADKFKLLRDLGFDGVEINGGRPKDREEIVKARDASGIDVHGVVCPGHWRTTLSHNDADMRAKGVENLRTALRDAKFYGATTVLLVPAVVDKETSYADAYTRSQDGIRKVLPLAEELGVKVAVENVWNNFLLSPLECARYIDELKSPWVGVYFDVGNIVAYGWPEHWIRTLGKRVLKLDVKEYSRAKRDAEGPRKGFQVELLEGDCDWPAVRKALADIGYEGWATAEVPGGDAKRLKFLAERMNRIFKI